jgi:REP element-mobilizing transposase RayT
MPHSSSCILIHLVFSTRNRERVLTPALQADLHPHLAETLTQLHCPPLQVGGVEDHVHLFFGLSPAHPVAEVTETVKDRSAKWLRARDAALAHFHWQTNYGAFSISHLEAETVANYLRNQVVHHQKMTYQEEFRRLLKWYQVAFDEKHVWD